MHIVVHSSMSEIHAGQWNSLVTDNNPFMRYEFLHGLELSGCVSKDRGWIPQHFVAYSDSHKHRLIGAMPCYVKSHSYGEYIFDWAWADAHHRHGFEYYPKLSNAVPFTPATGERILVATDENRALVMQALISKALSTVEQQPLSSFHSLFCSKENSEQLARANLLKRHSTQFHWRNRSYDNFDDFLAGMSSKKRKNIKRERRRVAESGVSYRWLSGTELNENAADTMHHFYARTIARYGAHAYLNRAFFHHLAQYFHQHTLFLFASYRGQTIAGGLYFKSDHTLYGRYWGALSNFDSVHFETCYYQAIEWCIKQRYAGFEAGAQGEHKLARGLEPQTTYSAHWIKHPQFRHAINEYLHSEQQHVEEYQAMMSQHSPFKACSGKQ